MCRVAAKPDKARTLTTMCTTIGSRRAAAPRSSAAGFLVKTELIPRRIGEYRKCAHACADIRTRRQNAPPCSLDPLERIGDSIHHDIGPCPLDRKSTRLNSSHVRISYAVFCLKKKRKST